MKICRFKFIIIIFCLCLYGLAQAGSAKTGAPIATMASSVPLTLERAKQTALENSPTLAAAGARVAQAIAAIEEARADYLPTVSVSASQNYTEKTDLNAVTDENLYTANLSASLVLFQGFYRKYNVLSAQYNEEMNRATLDETRRSLAWNVSQTFLNAQLALENIKIAQSDMDYNRALEKEAVAKERMGMGSYSDVLNYKTSVNTAKAVLIAAEQSYMEYIFGLAALMGYEDARLPAGMTIVPLAVSNRDAAAQTREAGETDMTSALENRPDIRKNRLAIQDADARVNRAKSEFFPTVALTGSYGADSAGDTDDFGYSDNLGACLGLEISFDLFTGGARRAAVRNVAAEKRALENDLKDSQITAKKEIRTTLAKVETAVRTLALQNENTDLMETTRDLVYKEYNAGQASLVRMNEAQNNLVSSQGSLADARISLSLALEELDYYTGRIVSLDEQVSE